MPPAAAASFRVEEYKKPEFEVTVDAPTDPVMLGDTVTATVKANYYFGAPVTNAKVHYKVLRTAYSSNWYPHRPLGLVLWARLLVVRRRLCLVSRLAHWGCARPIPVWWGYRAQPQPEVVLDDEASIGADGTLADPNRHQPGQSDAGRYRSPL